MSPKASIAESKKKMHPRNKKTQPRNKRPVPILVLSENILVNGVKGIVFVSRENLFVARLGNEMTLSFARKTEIEVQP